jgi:hypothetical protein
MGGILYRQASVNNGERIKKLDYHHSASPKKSASIPEINIWNLQLKI